MRRRSVAAFVAAFVLAGALAAVGYRFALWGAAVAACRHHPDPTAFLAYCEAPEFGHYEQGAFYLRLEPQALEALRGADVITFGTSRAQHAFSTDIVRAYFHARAIRFYALGFSYVEPAALPLAIVRNERLRPKIVIIVADTFFAPSEASPAIRAVIGSNVPLADRLSATAGYLAKSVFVAGWASFCPTLPLACPQRRAAIYRTRADGMWVWRDLYAADVSLAIPDDLATLEAYPRAYAARDRDAALQFLQAAGIPPACAVITATPTRRLNFYEYAETLGQSIGATVIVPRLSGLAAIDDNHLNWESAQRWSAAFLAEFDDVLRRCIHGVPPAG